MSSGNFIELSDRFGANPALIRCINCAKEYGIAFLGKAHNYSCSCGQTIIGKRVGTCPKCKSQPRTWRDNGAADGSETVLTQGYCTPCEDQLKLGSVLFKCEKCNSSGFVKHDVQLAIDVRKKLNIPTPGVCGVTLQECPECEAEEVTNDTNV